jgi:hypothetical protein
MGASGGFGSFGHLARRFFGALSPAGPPPSDEVWVRSVLLPGEVALWERMSGPDRRHALEVARDALARLGSSCSAVVATGSATGSGREAAGGVPAGAGREVAAAALLHDVGKIESDLGTFARVGVTVAAVVFGRDRVVAAGQGGSGGLRARAAGYLTHDRIGARLLREAGSHPTTSTWAEEHHLPEGRWSLERRVAEALGAADGD